MAAAKVSSQPQAASTTVVLPLARSVSLQLNAQSPQPLYDRCAARMDYKKVRLI